MNKRQAHRASFVKVTEHGSTFFRVTCIDTGATAMHWNDYLRPGHALTVWEEPYGECGSAEHVFEKTAPLRTSPGDTSR